MRRVGINRTSCCCNCLQGKQQHFRDLQIDGSCAKPSSSLVIRSQLGRMNHKTARRPDWFSFPMTLPWRGFSHNECLFVVTAMKIIAQHTYYVTCDQPYDMM